MMAAVCNSVYFDCLQEFQQDITTEIIKKDVKVDRLMEKAKKKGLLPSRLSVRPDLKRLAVSRENCHVVGSTVDVDHVMERDACSLLQQHMGQLQTCTYKSHDTHITQHYIIQPRNDRCLYTFR